MKNIKSITSIIGILAMFVLLSGCAMNFAVRPSSNCYEVNINSIAISSPDLKSKTYTLSSAMKNISSNDIQFKEFAGYVNYMLSKKGYKLVNKDADLLIRLAYGIGSPKTVTSSKTYTTSDGYGYSIFYDYWTYVPPTTETITTQKTTYKRYLLLEAYDVKDLSSQLWKITVKSAGTTSDLRIVFPSMLAAAAYKLGTNMMGVLTADVYSDSSYVLEIIPDSDRQEGTVLEERLGVRLRELDRKDQLVPYAYPDSRVGARVIEVVEGSVAQRMGIEKYDVITAVNNTLGYKLSDLLGEIRNIRPGGEVRITFYDWTKYETVVASDYLK